MCLRKLNKLWGTGHDRNLFIHLIISEFINSLFLWLFLTIWTLKMQSNNFSTNEIAICYAVSQICRILNAFYLKEHKWYSPIIALFIHLLILIPAILNSNSFISHFFLAFFKSGDMLTFYTISLNNITTNRKNIGSSNIVENRYRYSSTLLIGIWVIGYSISLMIGGYIYQYYSFELLVIIQFVGVIIQIIYCGILHFKHYDYSLNDEIVEMNTIMNTETNTNKYNLSLLDFFLLFILPLPIYGSSALNWQFMPIIYTQTFNLKSFEISSYLMMGDIISTIYFLYKSQKFNIKINLYCFREPRKFILFIFILGVSMILLTSNILILTLISQIFVGILLPILNKIHSNYVFVYSKNKNIKFFNGSFMIVQHIGRSISAITAPYLFDIYQGLPFQINGILLIFFSILSFFIFKQHIILNYKDEHIMTLSKSILKLEIEKYHIEKHEKYESKEEITL